MCWPYARKVSPAPSSAVPHNLTGELDRWGQRSLTPAEVHSTVDLLVCEIGEFWFQEIGFLLARVDASWACLAGREWGADSADEGCNQAQPHADLRGELADSWVQRSPPLFGARRLSRSLSLQNQTPLLKDSPKSVCYGSIVCATACM